MTIVLIPSYPNAERINVNTFTESSSFTTDETYKNSLVLLSGGTQTITVTNTLKVGEQITFIATGSGVKTFSGSGVTINSADSLSTIDTQWAAATVVCTASGVVALIGKLA